MTLHIPAWLVWWFLVVAGSAILTFRVPSRRAVAAMADLTAEDLESLDSADIDWVETAKALQREVTALKGRAEAAEAAVARVEALLAQSRIYVALSALESWESPGHAMQTTRDETLALIDAALRGEGS